MFDLTTNYFSVFGLQPTTELDLKALKSSYLELQRDCHPDKFSGENDEIQREAVQKASYLNQAYDTLRAPLKRAIYLLQQVGRGYDPETQIHNDPDFLMQQIELREQLSEAGESDDILGTLDSLRRQAKANFDSHYSEFASLFNEQNWAEAGAEINKMMFAFKLLAEVDEKEEVLFG